MRARLAGIMRAVAEVPRERVRRAAEVVVESRREEGDGLADVARAADEAARAAAALVRDEDVVARQHRRARRRNFRDGDALRGRAAADAVRDGDADGARAWWGV